MSTTPMKIEKNMCRCCLTEGDFKSLYASYFRMVNNELEEFIYSNMLRECFGIELATATESSDRDCGICHTCVVRLRDAHDFKLQVLKCEEEYRGLYTMQTCKQEDPVPVEIKLENLDPIDDHGAIDIDTAMDNRDLTQVKEFKQECNELSVDVAQVKKKVTKPVKKKFAFVKNARTQTDATEEYPENKSGKPFRLIKYVDYDRIGDLYQCLRCEKSNKSIDSIREHIKFVHLNIPKYACTQPDCNKTFLCIGPLTQHKFEEHNIDERHKCNACDRIYTSKVQLKKHKNCFHMMGRVQKCDLCNYECYSTTNLRKHKLSHKTEKDLHCRFCRKGFVRHSNLKLHEKIHTGVKDKICKECGQAFVQKASLNYHMTKYHPEVPF